MGDLFDRFWNAYPRKVSKAAARRAFQKVDPDEVEVQRWIRAIEEQRRERAWKMGDGRHVPDWKHPATWINGECWADEIESRTARHVPGRQAVDVCDVDGCTEKTAVRIGHVNRCAWHYSREQCKDGPTGLKRLAGMLAHIGLEQGPGEAREHWLARNRAYCTEHRFLQKAAGTKEQGGIGSGRPVGLFDGRHDIGEIFRQPVDPA